MILATVGFLTVRPLPAAAQSPSDDTRGIVPQEYAERIPNKIRQSRKHSQISRGLVAHVIAPDGKQVLEVETAKGDEGDEPIALITRTKGVYKLTVTAHEREAAPGEYEIRLQALRSPTAEDRALIVRNHALQEATTLSDEADEQYRLGKYDAALPLSARALAIRETTLGPVHPDTADALTSLAELYRVKGEYAKAEPLYRRALAIYETTRGPEHLDTATALSNLAGDYKETGEYAKAEPLYVRALAIYEKQLGPTHHDTAVVLNNLADLYATEGDYAKAEPLWIRSLGVIREAKGESDPETANSLINIAWLYYSRGDYAKAEPLYRRALAIYEQVLGPEHPDTATALNDLAELYAAKGDYKQAEPLYLRTLSIREKMLGSEHPETATALVNLAAFYKVKGDYARAEPLYLRALTIRQKALGEEHPDTANSLHHLAALYEAQGDRAKAAPLYLRALTIRERVLGTVHPDVAYSLNNLGWLYYSDGDYAKAEPLLKRALAIREKVLGTAHSDTATSLSNLAWLYAAEGDYAKAVQFQATCNEVSDRDLARNLSAGAEREKLAYLDKTALYTDFTISLHVQFVPDNRAAKNAALAVLLQRQGRALDAMIDTIGTLRRRASPDDQKLFAQIQEVRSLLSVVTLRGAGKEGAEEHKTRIKALETEEERLESDLSERSGEFRTFERTQAASVTPEMVQKAIPPGGALLEFALYRPCYPREPDKNKRFGSPQYVVYVLRDQGEAQLVVLGDAVRINSEIDALREALRDKSRQDVGSLARIVYEEVMAPIRRLLVNSRRVFISPDSTLTLLPFGALVDERGEYLVKAYHFTYLTSGRDLLRLEEKIESKTVPTVVADVDFDSKSDGGGALHSQEAARAANSVDVASESGDQGRDEHRGPKVGDVEFEPLKPLAGSAEEAADVKRILPQAILLLRGEATESAVKQVARPSILHVATHGYFLEREVRPGVRTSVSARLAIRRDVDDSAGGAALLSPSLRSGLFFAGANRGRSGSDDGILTALEAAGLDLWGTKLVVLSACDTGVGEVVTGQGVQGLRRAFVLAGSESQMMSLWPVSDSGTRELMIDYYQRLETGQGRSEALRQAQLKMLTNRRRRHPFYWASFIQSGEWANLQGKRDD